jgi:hypothetical protein
MRRGRDQERLGGETRSVGLAPLSQSDADSSRPSGPAALRYGLLPRWLGWAGFPAAALLTLGIVSSASSSSPSGCSSSALPSPSAAPLRGRRKPVRRRERLSLPWSPRHGYWLRQRRRPVRNRRGSKAKTNLLVTQTKARRRSGKERHAGASRERPVTNSLADTLADGLPVASLETKGPFLAGGHRGALPTRALASAGSSRCPGLSTRREEGRRTRSPRSGSRRPRV